MLCARDPQHGVAFFISKVKETFSDSQANAFVQDVWDGVLLTIGIDFEESVIMRKAEAELCAHMNRAKHTEHEPLVVNYVLIRVKYWG